MSKHTTARERAAAEFGFKRASDQYAVVVLSALEIEAEECERLVAQAMDEWIKDNGVGAASEVLAALHYKILERRHAHHRRRLEMVTKAPVDDQRDR